MAFVLFSVQQKYLLKFAVKSCRYRKTFFSGRQLTNLGFLQEKTNPGGFGFFTALSGEIYKYIREVKRALSRYFAPLSNCEICLVTSMETQENEVCLLKTRELWKLGRE